MENLELTYEESLELEKRGFFVKDNFNFKNYLIDTCILWVTIGSYVFIAFVVWSLILWEVFPEYSDIRTFIGIMMPVILIIIQYIMHYIFLWKSFFWQEYILIYWNLYPRNAPIKEKVFLRILRNYIENIFIKSNYLMMSIIIFTAFIVVGSIILNFFIWIFTWVFPVEFSYYLGLVIFTLILRQFIEYFHPLYAFGNIWKKIQKLTPEINRQSVNIQSKFKSDMNFSILNYGFYILSRNFSKIAQLIIKLEKAEKRANKWNLFDSEKYINSLRSDIVTPLISLRTFLEEKKIELIQSKQELAQVQIWWIDETGNIELQSKRSESLIEELTQNIEKLDIMIGKMG